MTTPRILHFIYFPWDARHQLKADESDFDHGPIEDMRCFAPDFDIRLWTFSLIRDFCLTNYPEIWEVVCTRPHPTMMVDILRWLVVYHYGGIYWQISTTPLMAMDRFMPSIGKRVRLFTEFVLSPEECNKMSNEPIRQGQPEEPVRVMNQVFAAYPKEAFIAACLEFIIQRNQRYSPKTDYDILFIGANAAVSTVYERLGKQDSSVELVGLGESRRMMKWRYEGAWRKSMVATESPDLRPETIARSDRFATLSLLKYRWFVRHPHDLLMADLNRDQPRQSCLPAIAEACRGYSVKSILEVPAGDLSEIPHGIRYIGGVMSSRGNRKAFPSVPKQASLHYINLLYSTCPRVDMVMIPDFLEWLPYQEIIRLLSRLARSSPCYFSCTGYALLRDNWDTAFGDFRPICFQKAPLCLPAPDQIVHIGSRAEGLRPDRCMMIWPGSVLKAIRPFLGRSVTRQCVSLLSGLPPL